jgi:succinate dehydrogenase / fumarate reductase, membrane anchor subunit
MMRYLTDRKRAEGKGSAHSGAHHHWSMTLTSVGLAFLVPVWLYLFGSTLGMGHAAVLERFSSPFAAMLTALVLVVGLRHFAMGSTTMIEDYLRGSARKAAVIGVVLFSWALGAMGLFALARIAL